MRRLNEIIASIRAHRRCELKHKKMLQHAHHGLHTSYLGWYVIDWHLPVSIIAAGLLAVALVSWVFHLELE